jgi:hypothetical protein
MDEGQRFFLADGLVGETVLLQYTGTQLPETEVIDEMINDPQVIVSANPQVLSLFVRLAAYDQAGIIAEDLTENPERFFVSWGVISRIQAVNLEDLAQGEG